MSYAVFVAGGKQYRVSEGDRVKVDFIHGKTKGDEIVFDDILLVKSGDQVKVGAPKVSGAKVVCSVFDNGEEGEGFKDKKIIVFKKRRRQGYHKKQGHRQLMTIVHVKSISA